MMDFQDIALAMLDSVGTALGVGTLSTGTADEGHPFSIAIDARDPGVFCSLSLEAEQVLIPLSLPGDELARLLPRELEPVRVVDNGAICVICSRFDLEPCLGIRRKYNEIAYAIAVSHRGLAGLYFLQLDLNWKEGMIGGVEHFGLPKQLGRVSCYTDTSPGGLVWMESRDLDGRRRFAMTGREQLGLRFAGIASCQSLWLRHLEQLSATGFFVKDGNLVSATAVNELRSLRSFQVSTFEIPELERSIPDLWKYATRLPAVARTGRLHSATSASVLAALNSSSLLSRSRRR